MDTGQAILDAATPAELVQRLSEKLRANYVFPDVAEQITPLSRTKLATWPIGNDP